MVQLAILKCQSLPGLRIQITAGINMGNSAQLNKV